MQEPLVLTYLWNMERNRFTDSQYTSMMGDAKRGLVRVQELKDAGCLQPTSLYRNEKKGFGAVW